MPRNSFRFAPFPAGLALWSLLSFFPLPAAAAPSSLAQESGQEQPSLTPEVGEELETAEKALENKDPEKAMQDIARAGNIPHTNAFDQYMIQRMRAAACTQTEDIKCAISAYDYLFKSDYILPDEKKRMLSAVAALAYRDQNYQRCETAAQEYLEKNAYDPVMATLLVQCPYVGQDWQATVKAGQMLFRLTEKNHQKMSESSLQMMAIAYDKLHQPDQERQIYALLADQYPNPRYWEFLLHDLMLDTKMPQRLRFNIMRLRLEAGAKFEPKEFQDMAERAIQIEVPSLAMKLLQVGYSQHILGEGDEKTLQEQERFKNFTAQQVYKARRGMNDAIIQARKASAAGALLSTGYELVLEGHAAAGLALMREGMENHPNYPDIAALEYAMAEFDAGQIGPAIRHFQNIPGQGRPHELGVLWAKQLQSKVKQ